MWAAVVSVRFPELSQSPMLAKPCLLSMMSSTPVLCDLDPLSPKIVTVDPGSRSQFALRVTVMVLTTAANGVLCSMVLMSKAGTRTSKGSVPFGTPSSSCPFFIAAVATTGDTSPYTDLTPARMLTAGDDWALTGFVRLKRIS